MPRIGGVYSPPSGTKGSPNTTIQSAKYNALVDDLTADANEPRPITAGGTGASSATGAREMLGVKIGTDVQAYDSGLASIAGLTTVADRLLYTTATDVYATTALTPFARTILDDANAAAVRTTLGLVIGTDVQAYDADTAKTDVAQTYTAPILLSPQESQQLVMRAFSSELLAYLRWQDETGAPIGYLGLDSRVGNNLTLRRNGVGNIDIHAGGAAGTVTVTGTLQLSTVLGLAYGGTGAATASDARSNLGLRIGVDVQPYNANTAFRNGANDWTNVNTFAAGAIFEGSGQNLIIRSNNSTMGPCYARFQGSGGTPLGYVGYGGANNDLTLAQNRPGNISISPNLGNIVLDATGGDVRSSQIRDTTTANSANGYVNTSSGALMRSTSSARYKTQIEDADLNLSRSIVLNSRPVWYRSTCDSDNADWSYWGLIAEEVALLDPRLVHWAYPLKTETVEETFVIGEDEEGNPVTETVKRERQVSDETQPLRPESVMYERFVVHLLSVIQKQEERLNALEQAGEQAS